MYSEITVEYMNSHKVIAYKILIFLKNTTVSYGNMNKKSFFSKTTTLYPELEPNSARITR